MQNQLHLRKNCSLKRHPSRSHVPLVHLQSSVRSFASKGPQIRSPLFFSSSHNSLHHRSSSSSCLPLDTYRPQPSHFALKKILCDKKGTSQCLSVTSRSHSGLVLSRYTGTNTFVVGLSRPHFFLAQNRKVSLASETGILPRTRTFTLSRPTKHPILQNSTTLTMGWSRTCLKFTGKKGFCSHTPSFAQTFQNYATKNNLKKDHKQDRVVSLLDDVSQQLHRYARVKDHTYKTVSISDLHLDDNQSTAWNVINSDLRESNSGGGGFFSRFFNAGGNAPSKKKKTTPLKEYHSPKGLYLYGGVGLGKTMILNLFGEYLQIQGKKRVHFHEFMLDVHAKIHRWRMENPLGTGLRKGDQGDPIPVVATQLAKENWFLCFDEFQVNDVADALILRRLFGYLFDHGCVMVSTSNRPPEDLYEHGLNRELFLPFIDLLRQKCDIIDIDELKEGTDYRQLSEKSENVVWYVGSEGRKDLESAWEEMKSELGVKEEPKDVVIGYGGTRSMRVPRAAGKVCRLDFNEICGVPVGPEDYIELTKHFHTFFVSDIPKFSRLNNGNLLSRWITLIDILYERNIGLYCNSNLEISNLVTGLEFKTDGTIMIGVKPSKEEVLGDTPYLYRPEHLTIEDAAEFAGNEEVKFACRRMMSRLIEMGGKEYWKNHAARFAQK